MKIYNYLNNKTFQYIFVCIILLCSPYYSKAQNNPLEIVKSFGESLSLFCSTGEIKHRAKIDELCSGHIKCRVEDKILAEYQKKRGLTGYETFVLDSYLNMFQTLISQSISYTMSNIKIVDTDEMPDGTLTFITADIKVSGALNQYVTDLFLVRGDDITGIYSYSSNLGFSHLNGSLIRALKEGRYKWADCIINGFVHVANEAGNHGLIDIKGNVIVPCIWESIRYNGGDFAQGFNFSNNSTVKDVTYDLRVDGKRTPLNFVHDFYAEREFTNFFASPHAKFVTFSEGYAVVHNEHGEYGYLNVNDYTYNNVQYVYDDANIFRNGYALVEYNGVGMIIDKSFTPILKDDKKYSICDRLYNGLAKVKDRVTGMYGFVNKKGKLIIPCIFSMAGYFSNGVCPVARIDNASKYKYGCIDTKGKAVIPLIYDNMSRIYENRYVQACINGHTTLLGLDGRPLPGFSWEYDDVSCLHEGLVRFEKDGKLGFLNATGEVVISPIYDFATLFVDGIACVSIHDKYGKHKYGGINTEGILVIPCIYDSIFYFENGIALVEKNNQVWLIDKYGNSTFFYDKQK